MAVEPIFAVINADASDYTGPAGFTKGTMYHNGPGDYSYFFTSGFKIDEYNWDSSVWQPEGPGWAAYETVHSAELRLDVIVKRDNKPTDHAFRWDGTPK
jgi:hypothetical protein